MARMALWAAEPEIDDLQDVDAGLAVGDYGQSEIYDDSMCNFQMFSEIY
jgi:hypothetical protein